MQIELYMIMQQRNGFATNAQAPGQETQTDGKG